MMTAPERPLESIITLNFNGRRHLEYALPSILATDYTPLQVILVGNGSTDGSAAYIRAHFPQVEVISSPRNLGWAAGNNLGIARAREAGAAFVALANNDVRVAPDWIAAAVQAAQSEPRADIIGFDILDSHGSGETHPFEDALAGRRPLEWREVEGVDGMALFAPMPLFEEIGLIDEDFFAYAEDNDLVLRARRAGYRVLRLNVPVWHYGQGIAGRRPLWAASMQIRNNIRLALKHEDAVGILYQVARHFAKGCLPFVRVDKADLVARRLRPSHPLVNFGLLLYALGWNVGHLPATLRARRRDLGRAARARRRWED